MIDKTVIFVKHLFRNPFGFRPLIVWHIIFYCLAISLVPIVVFLVIYLGRSVTYAEGTAGSLTVSWTRPTGLASFVDAGNKIVQCSDSDLDCSTEPFTYFPGSSLIYSVKVSNSTGAVIKSGGTTASADGKGTANWNWTYTVVVYPDFAGSTCQNTGASCKIRTLSNDSPSVSVSFTDLSPGLLYKEIVCAPDCGTGTKIFEATQSTTNPQAAVLSGAITNCSRVASSTSENIVNVAFGWTKATGANYDLQYLDYSVYDNGFAQGSFVGVNVGVSASVYSGTGFAQGTKYYWRVNSHISGGNWVTSTTGNFTTPLCSAPSGVGEQRTAVILVNFANDRSEKITKQQAAGRIFSNSDSANAWYKEASYNKTYFTGDVFGYYRLAINSTCDIQLIERVTIEAADADINFTNYHNLMIIHPPDPACSWFGISYPTHRIDSADGSALVVSELIEDVWFGAPGLVEHEIGHSLGSFAHSGGWECGALALGGSCSPVVADGDPFEPMGASDPFKKPAHFGAFSKERLGWFTASNVINAKSSGNYTIEPIETATNGPKTLKVPTAIPNMNYYVEYRSPIGYDQGLPGNVYKGALIRFGPWVVDHMDQFLIDNTPNSVTAKDDFKDAALEVGKTFKDPATGTTITVTSVTPSSLTVNVAIGGSSSDADRDEFSDSVETFMGTNPNLACGANAWPPDFDSNRTVAFSDLIKFAYYYNTIAGDGKYNKRYDLNADNKIGFADQLIFAKYYNKSC